MKNKRPKKEKAPRNVFEQRLWDTSQFGEIEYESDKIPYRVESNHNYIPDFTITRTNGEKVYVEAKGYLRPADMTKMKLVKAQHPELDIRFVFYKDQKIPRARNLKYTDWATKNGFPYSIGIIPVEWFR